MVGLVTPRKADLSLRSARKTDRSCGPNTVERPSVLSLSSRPSVAPGRNVSTAKDRRPVGDRQFQTKCVRDIVAFLREHMYPGLTDERALRTGPNRKDFYLMMDFLHQLALQVHLVGGDFEASEDGVVRVFKQLRYPFMMSTTFLRAINAPGTWPTVLAAVHWLVNIVAAAHAVDCTLTYKHRSEEEDRPSVIPGLPSPRGPRRTEPAPDPAELLHVEPHIFHQYVLTTYEQFMLGDDQGMAATDHDLKVHIEESVSGVEAEEQGLAKRRRQLSDAVATLESAQAIDKDVLAKGAQGEQQCEKYRLLLASQDEHTAELESAVAAMASGVQRQEAEAQLLDQELAALAKQVSEQEWTAEAVAKLRGEQAASERATRALLEEQALLAQEVAARSERAGIAAQAVVRAVRELQAHAGAHPTSEAAAALRGLRPDTEAPEGASIVGVDLRDVTLVLRSQLDEQRDALEQLEDAARSGEDEVERLETEARELEGRSARADQRIQHQHRLQEQQATLHRSKWDAQSEELSALEKENCGGNSDLQSLQAKVRDFGGQAQALEQSLRAQKLAASDAEAGAEQRLQAAVDAAHAEKRAVLEKLEGLRARTAA